MNLTEDAVNARFDLKIVGWIIFEFDFLFELVVDAAAPLEAEVGLEFELALAFGTYVRPCREAENIFRFELPE